MWVLAVSSALLLNLWHCLRYHAWLLRPQSCTGLTLDSAGATLVQRDGKQGPGEISPDSLVTPWLVVVNLAIWEQRRTRSIVILPDSMHNDAFRQLRVWLKWGWSGGEVAGRGEHGGRG